MLVRCIIEMMGAPKEHVESTLKGYVERWREDGIKILSAEYAPLEEKNGLWATFVDLEVEFVSSAEVLGFALDALPSSLEVLEPERVELISQDFTALLNDFLAKLHESDMLVKNMRAQAQLLDKNVLHTFRNFIVYALKQGSKDVGELAAIIGAKEDQLQPFLDKMLEENLLKVSDGKYAA